LLDELAEQVRAAESLEADNAELRRRLSSPPETAVADRQFLTKVWGAPRVAGGGVAPPPTPPPNVDSTPARAASPSGWWSPYSTPRLPGGRAPAVAAAISRGTPGSAAPAASSSPVASPEPDILLTRRGLRASPPEPGSEKKRHWVPV
jgi:hypothetical protein